MKSSRDHASDDAGFEARDRAIASALEMLLEAEAVAHEDSGASQSSHELASAAMPADAVMPANIDALFQTHAASSAEARLGSLLRNQLAPELAPAELDARVRAATLEAAIEARGQQPLLRLRSWMLAAGLAAAVVAGFFVLRSDGTLEEKPQRLVLHQVDRPFLLDGRALFQVDTLLRRGH
ncbi:MAG TPA: hypothetical protein PKA88_20840 [Polyangiaceae bacterium]|nr:hypothetical protein [Polyangiaceae bacterium]